MGHLSLTHATHGKQGGQDLIYSHAVKVGSSVAPSTGSALVYCPGWTPGLFCLLQLVYYL